MIHLTKPAAPVWAAEQSQLPPLHDAPQRRGHPAALYVRRQAGDSACDLFAENPVTTFRRMYERI